MAAIPISYIDSAKESDVRRRRESALFFVSARPAPTSYRTTGGVRCDERPKMRQQYYDIRSAWSKQLVSRHTTLTGRSWRVHRAWRKAILALDASLDTGNRHSTHTQMLIDLEALIERHVCGDASQADRHDRVRKWIKVAKAELARP